MAPKKKATLFTYSVGERKLNRIRVYERKPGGPIWLEYRDRHGRRIQEPLGKPFGITIRDQALAKEIAHKIAEARRKKVEAETTAELVGKPLPRTVSELLTALHTAKEDEWKHHHARTQRMLQSFWVTAIGKHTLTEVTPALVEDVVRSAAKVRGWSDSSRRKYLRYIKDAFTFAQNRLKWITEANNLSALVMPKVDPDSEELTYEPEEVAAMLEVAHTVDLRCAAMIWIMWETGRRFEAVRQLRASAYEPDAEGGWVHFPGETDKARRKGLAALTDEAAEVVWRLITTPAVQASGILFPAGDLDSPKVRRTVVGEKALRDWLDDVEKLAEVESVPGRAYHGIKRTFATVAEDVEAASEQSGTTTQTLRKHYRKPQKERKRKGAEQAKRIRKKVSE